MNKMAFYVLGFAVISFFIGALLGDEVSMMMAPEIFLGLIIAGAINGMTNRLVEAINGMGSDRRSISMTDDFAIWASETGLDERTSSARREHLETHLTVIDGLNGSDARKEADRLIGLSSPKN
jgi:hypothetical protein